MRIKLAILEKDEIYLNRIVAVFSTKYSDKFEIYSFTDEEVAFSVIESKRIDVLIASNAFDIDVEKLPKKCGFAYFVETNDVESVNDQRAICKFQKVDLIYKQILSIYSENAGSISGLKLTDDNARIVAFCSASGGVGSSTMAVACAVHYASLGMRTLYLNFEKFASSDIFFSGDGQFDMSDIIFALKSQKANLAMKLESCVKQDATGVYFYSKPKVALDIFEIGAAEIMRLINEIKISGSYDCIVLDMDFSLDKDYLNMFRDFHAVVWVGNGSEISNAKTINAYESLSILEKNSETPLTGRISYIYNMFSNKSSKTITEVEELRNIGGVPRYEHSSVDQVVKQISTMQMFDNIF